jgi:hypothetical protein
MSLPFFSHPLLYYFLFTIRCPLLFSPLFFSLCVLLILSLFFSRKNSPMSCKKAVLFERGLALAVAMRSFRVGAIALPPPPLLPGLPPPSPATAGAAGAGAGAADRAGGNSALSETGSATTVGGTAGGGEGEGGALAVAADTTAAAATAAAAAAAAAAARRVTIETALQFAVREQASGKHLVAEAVYRDILAAHPSHAEALHLLGLAHYQRGLGRGGYEISY